MLPKVLTEAEKIAQRSRCKYRHGAIVIKNGRIISAGYNKNRHTPYGDSWRTASFHAEEVALNMLRPGVAVGATIVVVRLGKSGDKLPSAPCLRCESAISRAKIRRVIHS